jgi:hypothetical protein
MVANELKEQDNTRPIELAPLYFNVKDGEFSVSDLNPFLIAVEFALQGKSILIQSNLGNPYNNGHPTQDAISPIQEITQLMNKMGVPQDKITVSVLTNETTQATATAFTGVIARGVYFTAR